MSPYSPGRWAAALVATAIGLAALRWATAAPLPFRSPGEARLRLSWTARPERIEVCRALSAEELARRPEHMRQRVECEGTFATYALRVRLGDSVAGDLVVTGAGLRQDRPMHVLREFSLSPGTRRVQVTFERREEVADSGAAAPLLAQPEADTGLFAGRAERELAERARRTRVAVPSKLALDTLVEFAPNRTALVTFDPERRVLELRTEPVPPR